MIYIKDQKTTLCKGDYRPAQFYKGKKKIAGYKKESFESEERFTLENCYNDRLHNAKIYGAAEGVGDLVGEGEHSGKYRIGVVARGKNLIDSDLWLPYFDKLEDGSYKSNRIINTSHRVAVNLPAGVYNLSIDVKCPKGKSYHVYFYDAEGNAISTGYVSSNGEWNHRTVSFTLPDGAVSMGWYYNDFSNEVYFRNLQVEIGNIETEFEKYKAPHTVEIYIDAPLLDGEHIDFEKGKVVRGKVTEEISLPVLPTTKGSTVYEIDTQIPAKISGEYKKMEE